jgi:hypothetical protein
MKYICRSSVCVFLGVASISLLMACGDDVTVAKVDAGESPPVTAIDSGTPDTGTAKDSASSVDSATDDSAADATTE